MLFWKAKKYVMDLATLADPNVVRFLELGIVSGRFILPEPPQQAETEEETHQADRARENVERLRQVKGITVRLETGLLEAAALAAALRRHKATLITTSTELKRTCDGLPAVSTDDIYSLFRPVYLTGDRLRLRIVRPGKEKDEGIGYLDGGIKVVVENASGQMGKEIDIIVKGALDTDVGQVIFARPRFSEVK
jgi:uncharacterized protein YacL